MRIEKIRVEGFRLLEDVEITLEPGSTVIVGRNNSGKTSLTEVFDRFVGDHGPKFRLEDFSVGKRDGFAKAKALRDKDEDPEKILAALPKIAITLTIRYAKEDKEFGPLAPFVIDLDEESTTAITRVEYAASLKSLDALLTISPTPESEEPLTHLFRCIRESLPKAYSVQLLAIDPTDQANRRRFEGTAPLDALVQCGFVRAQRTLDQSKRGDTDVIGKLLGALFKTATEQTASKGDQDIATALKGAVDSIEKDIQTNFDGMVKQLLPALQMFGFPSLSDTELRPETALDVNALLADHTKIFYSGDHGIHLPEGYNGLGTRNLIYMLLQLETFHKAYRARATRPKCPLVFIEEPEAHLHPQMQEVFISQLNAAVSALSEKYEDEEAWPVQFVVSTHSSHIANAASFEAVRYFLSSPATPAAGRRTKVKDFRKGSDEIDPVDREFLHQYMTLTKCDLYFADKAILVEGATERILMPKFVSKVDSGLAAEKRLCNQYVTTIEVGGAYAHVFYPLLDFLELKSLVITDLDATYLDTSTSPNRWKKCPTSRGTRTSNAAVRRWFEIDDSDKVTLADLVAMPDTKKVSGFRRIAYQIPEEGLKVCARSYEDALILANLEMFELADGDLGEQSWEKAKGFSKADDALRFAIQETGWSVPRYIREGLLWLTEPPPPRDNIEVVASTEAVEA